VEWLLIRLVHILVQRVYEPVRRTHVVPKGLASLSQAVAILDHRTHDFRVPPDAVERLLSLERLAAEVRGECCYIPPFSELGTALTLLEGYRSASDELAAGRTADVLRIPCDRGTAIVCVRFEPAPLPADSAALREQAA